MEKNPDNKVKNNKAKKKKTSKGKILDRVIIVFLTLALIGGVTIFGVFAKIISSVDTKGLPDKIVSKEPSEIFGLREGKPVSMGEIGGESRENITYEQIPQVTIDAFLAIEDSRFYSHNGFDLPRFISSALNNLREGDLSQGGSTLTMQAIDNYIMKPQEEADNKNGIYYSSMDKIVNKIKEIYQSMVLENDMSKEDIITSYLNQINFGQHARGIQKGAEYYFGKNVEDLNLSESAFLAGVINAPNAFNPYNGVVTITNEDGSSKTTNYYKDATERRDVTLYQMFNHGYITEDEYKLAKSTKLAFQLNGGSSSSRDNAYNAIVVQVAKEVMKQTGDDPYTTPMKIYTSIDLDAQEQAEAICAGEGISYMDNKYFQLGFTLLNNQTGEITAIGPGLNVDYTTGNWKDQATELHQPGSSIKPVIDYALTFDKLGWSTAHTLKDEAIDMGSGNMLRNADGTYRGEVSMEQAVTESLNPPAINALKAVIGEIGVSGVTDYLNAAGFTDTLGNSLQSDDFNLGYGIGGSNMYASTTDMAAAYAAFANGGYYIEPHLVTKIEYKDGSKTESPAYEKVQIMSEQAAYMMSDLLNKAVSGTYSVQGAFLRDLMDSSYTAYGKTGTSNWGVNEYGIDELAMKDNWMIGYTSNYVCATWTGFDITGKEADASTAYMTYNDLLSTRTPGTINHLMLKSVSSGSGPIQRPSGLSEVTVMKGQYPYKIAPKGAKDAITGLIKTEYVKDLKEATITPPDSLVNFKVDKVDLNGTDIVFTFGAYPGDVNSDMIKTYGDIVYRVTIKVDGSIVKDETYTSTSGTITGAIPEGKTGTVCGFYQYKNSTDDKAKSNEICTDISASVAVNKDVLNTQITAAQALINTDYTPESWAAMQSALASANITQSSNIATQGEVDTAASTLKNAIDALVKTTPSDDGEQPSPVI